MIFVGELACLGAALMWAVAVAMFRPAIAEYGARTINLVKGLVATVLLALSVLALGSWRDLSLASPAELGFLALSGLVGLTMGDTALFAAVPRVGVHRSLLLQTAAPLFAAAIAALALDEVLSGRQMAGGAAVLVGVAVVILQRAPAGVPPLPRRTLVLGIVFGLLGALGQGAGVVLAKLGLVEIPVLHATLVRLVAASAGLLLIALVTRNLAPLAAALSTGRSLRRLLPAAFFGTYVAMLLLMLGVAMASASVAAVLLATPPVFSLIIESVGRRRVPAPSAVLGTLVAIAGVALLSSGG